MAKERPILFSTPMVEAILDGRKVQTRRTKGLDRFNEAPDKWYFSHDRGDGYYCFKNPDYKAGGNVMNPVVVKCPYGQVEDILWIRETWKKNEIPMGWPYHYKAANDTFTHPENEKWKPSIHMPKDACRIRTGVIGIRIERLKEITCEDAIAEGSQARSHRCGGFGYYEGGGEIWDCECQNWEAGAEEMGYFDLWSEINGEESTKSNPWVWVIEFKKLA